jgi:ribosome-associated toxin RatA of RatAB toxin-antitoxin module
LLPSAVVTRVTVGLATGEAKGVIMNRIALIIVSVIVMTARGVAQDEPTVNVNESGGLYRVAAAFTVPQPASFARAALTDYSQIPRFMPEVRSSQVVERADDRAVVAQEAIATFMMFSKRIYLVLDVQEDGTAIRFTDRCGKSFEHYEGTWTFAEYDRRTQITYELTAKPSFNVPEFLLTRLMKRDASQMIERLKTEIAARAGLK